MINLKHCFIIHQSRPCLLHMNANTVDERMLEYQLYSPKILECKSRSNHLQRGFANSNNFTYAAAARGATTCAFATFSLSIIPLR